jgi:predicted DNA-binding transcriptional regulator AlpA
MPTFIKLEQVLERLQISRTTLWRIVKEGQLQSYRFRNGKLKFFKLEEVEAFQAASMTPLTLVPSVVSIETRTEKPTAETVKRPGRPRKGAVVDFKALAPRRKSA